MRRTKWTDPVMLSDELFLVFSRVPETSTGPITAASSNPAISPTTFPPTDDLNIEPLDLAFLDFPDLQQEPVTTESPELPNGGRQIVNTRQATKREVVPGTILSGSGDTYSVEIYPNGLDNYLLEDADDRDTGDIDTKGTITVKHPQMASSSSIPAGTWVWIWRLAQITIVETIITGPDGQILSKTTDISESSVENLLMHPVWV